MALATYNGADYIEAQLKSILAQHRPPDEIVISDDGSTDGTVERARELLSRTLFTTRIVIQAGPRQGITANFEAAISACSGNVVLLSDQDDVWRPDRLQISLDRFESDTDLLLHHADARLIDARGKTMRHSLYQSLGIRGRDIASINLGKAFGVYIRRNLATGAVTAFRRELFDLAAPLPDEWLHDEWLAILAAATGKVRASTEFLIGYRQHSENEIGATHPTLLYRVRRVLADPPGRNRRLAVRGAILAARLDDLSDVSDTYKAAANRKARFEKCRADLPARRLRRLPAVIQLALKRDYAIYASQGWMDVLRDLIRHIE